MTRVMAKEKTNTPKLEKIPKYASVDKPVPEYVSASDKVVEIGKPRPSSDD